MRVEEPRAPSRSGQTQAPYTVGIMLMEVEGKNSDAFRALVADAAEDFGARLAETLDLRVETLSFEGPHLTPAAGAYAPTDFLEIGLAEKIERKIPFLLLVTEVDLSSSGLSFTLALPSQVTNVGVVSTKRLDPAFWGDDPDPARHRHRLTALLLHTFGHLLNLHHDADASNVMHAFARVEALDAMHTLTDAQRARMRTMLPREAHERVARSQGWWSRWSFALRMIAANLGSIGAAVGRANPLRLVGKMPTMLTAALSVIVVLFFSAEVWDVAGSVGLGQVILFSVASLGVAVYVLYTAFSFGTLLNRERLLSESTVVTETATLLSLLGALVLLFILFGGLMYLATITVFPKPLMETWPTVDPATSTLEHLKLCLFLAGMGILAGSLGGRADSRSVVRTVLFVDEQA